MASDAGAKLDPLIGRTIRGRFRVLRKLGEGGMGVVYLADQLSFHRRVALKVLHGVYTSDEEFTERFRREARLAAMLNHAHIVTVYDFDQGEDGSLFIAMEYVEGRNLREIIQEGRLALPEAVRFARQIAEGLDSAHRAGVIHRDIKPENIMVSNTNNEVKLMDFGIASMKDTEEMSRLTRTGTIIGTPTYMAPERIERGQTDEKTDIYSFGILLYEMLTGDVPFAAPTPAAILVKQLQELPRPVRTIRAEIPAALEAVVMQAIKKEPQKRQATMGKIAQALQEIENSLAVERPKPQTLGGLGISGRAVALIATLVLGTGTTVWRWIAEPPEKPSAKLAEPPVPSTPSLEKPLTSSRTQELEGSKKSPVSPAQVVSKTPPEPEPSVSKLPADVPQTPPIPIKEAPATKSKEKPAASTGGQGTKSETESLVYPVQTVIKPTPEPSSSSKPAKDVTKVSPPSAKQVSPQKPQEEPAFTQPVETAKVSPPEPPSRPSPPAISQAEVTAWLETYRQAWEEKDIDRLVQLGGVPAQQANKVREGLSRYESFHVIFKDVDIRREGTRATVSFTRVDTIDGRDHIHPDRKILIIEKQGGDLVSRQP